MSFVCFNGEIINKDEISIDDINRCFNFGDGLFETIRIADTKPLFLDAHFKRFFKGLAQLKIDVPEDFTPDFLEQKIVELITCNQISAGGRLKLVGFRKGSGAYRPETNSIGFLIEVFPLENNHYSTNKKGLSISLFNDLYKTPNKLSIFKTSNAITYVLASIYAKEKNFDDVLILNDKGNVIESTNSNIFISSNGVLYTPPLSEGCVAGVMRMKLINLAIANGMLVYENKMPPQHLMAADEILLTNTIQGIRWIGKYTEKRYFNSLAKKLTDALNDEVINYQKDLMES